jgi:hypothetical protein
MPRAVRRPRIDPPQTAPTEAADDRLARALRAAAETEDDPTVREWLTRLLDGDDAGRPWATATGGAA